MTQKSDIITAHFIGDIHISDRHITLTDEALANSIKLVQKRPNVDFVCVMGDVFDTHRNLRMDLRNKAIDFIKALSNIRPTVVLIGNHDRVNNKDYMSDIHPYYGMEDISKKLYIVHKPKVLTINNNHVLFMPYVYPGRFMEAINQYLSQMHAIDKLLNIKSVKDFAMIFAHQEFKGARYGPIVSVNGDEWDKSYPMVVSGHIHDRTMLQSNIFYTGSLYPITASEGNDKGVITGTYNVVTKEFTHKVVVVVTSQKKIRRIDANDMIETAEMIALEHENTKYIIKGTADEIGAIRERIKSSGKKINWVPDLRTNNKKITSHSFDDIIRERVTDPDVKELLAQILE